MTVAAGLLLGVRFLFDYRGVGGFDQDVVIETRKAIRSVTYCDWTADDETRRRAEQTADPNLFDCKEVPILDGNHFIARVTFTDRFGPLRRTQVFHRKHLVVYINFDDGSGACVVSDIPAGMGKVPIVIKIE